MKQIMENMKNSNINNPLHVEAIFNERPFRVCLWMLNVFIPLNTKCISCWKLHKNLTFRNMATDVIKHTLKTD